MGRCTSFASCCQMIVCFEMSAALKLDISVVVSLDTREPELHEPRLGSNYLELPAFPRCQVGNISARATNYVPLIIVQVEIDECRLHQFPGLIHRDTRDDWDAVIIPR